MMPCEHCGATNRWLRNADGRFCAACGFNVFTPPTLWQTFREFAAAIRKRVRA